MTRVIILDEDYVVIKRFDNLLRCCGIYLKQKKHYDLLTLIVSLIICSGVILMSWSIYMYIFDMDALATIVHHYMLLMDVAVGLVITVNHRPTILNMIKEIRKTHDYKSKIMSDFTLTLMERRMKNMDLIFKLIVSSASYMMSNLIVNAYVEKYFTNKFMLLFPSWFPFDLNFIVNHIMAYLWQFIIVSLITLMAFGVQAFLYLNYSHIKSEFALLVFALKKINERALELVNSTASESDTRIKIKEAYIDCVRHCAKHHVEITKHFNDVKHVLSYMYLATFTSGLVLCVCVGFALVSDNTLLKIKFFGITTIQLIYFFILSWFGEAIGEEGEKIRLVIYGLNWYDMPKECQSTLRLMVERTNTPLTLISASGHKANLDTYMSMIKASYSYFNMMLAAQT